VPASHVSSLVGILLRTCKLAAPYLHVASVGGPLVCNTYLEGSMGQSQSDIPFLLLPLAAGGDSTSSEIGGSYVPLDSTSVSSAENEFLPVVGAALVVDNIVGDASVCCLFGGMLLWSGSGSSGGSDSDGDSVHASVSYVILASDSVIECRQEVLGTH
jgi:hypothetical protein